MHDVWREQFPLREFKGPYYYNELDGYFQRIQKATGAPVPMDIIIEAANLLGAVSGMNHVWDLEDEGRWEATLGFALGTGVALFRLPERITPKGLERRIEIRRLRIKGETELMEFFPCLIAKVEDLRLERGGPIVFSEAEEKPPPVRIPWDKIAAVLMFAAFMLSKQNPAEYVHEFVWFVALLVFVTVSLIVRKRPWRQSRI